MEVFNYSIVHILREINVCIDKKLYYVALTTALTIPDICSKLVSDEKQVKDRYVQWCNRYLFEYLPVMNKYLIQKTDWGNIIYQLRCSILHNAENDVEKKPEKYGNFKVSHFKFYVDDNEECYTQPLVMNTKKNLCDRTFKQEVAIDINIGYMAFILVQGAMKFIKENKIEECQFPSLEIELKTYGNSL